MTKTCFFWPLRAVREESGFAGQHHEAVSKEQIPPCTLRHAQGPRRNGKF